MTRNNNYNNNNNNNNNTNTDFIPSIYQPIPSTQYIKTYQNLSKHQFTEYEKMFLCECYLNGSKSVIGVTTTKG